MSFADYSKWDKFEDPDDSDDEEARELLCAARTSNPLRGVSMPVRWRFLDARLGEAEKIVSCKNEPNRSRRGR